MPSFSFKVLQQVAKDSNASYQDKSHVSLRDMISVEASNGQVYAVNLTFEESDLLGRMLRLRENDISQRHALVLRYLGTIEENVP